jgi:LacI family transcriptional regulator
MAGRATITQIARRLGVAPSTVSRAFNEPRLLRPETVARVKAVADEMGYVANRHARALITGRSGAIGLIVPDITNPFFPLMIRFAQREAEALDQVVLVVETDSEPEQERRQIASLLAQTEGLIIASSRLP